MATRVVDDDLAFVEAGLGADLDTMLVYNLLRTHSHLGPLVDLDLRPHNLTAAQFNVLLVLRSAGGEGLQMGQIGRRLIVTKSNVTGLVDRLERDGLVGRAECRDRRATTVRLTPAGQALMDRAAPRHARGLCGLTGDLSAAEKQTLVRLLTKLRRALRQRKGQP